MKRSIWGSLILVLVIVVLAVVMLNGRQHAAAEALHGLAPQDGNPTGVDQTGNTGPSSQEPISGGANQPAADSSSQGGESRLPLSDTPGAALDDFSIKPDATARFYHIPGSALTPVNSSTTLVYDSMGCIHTGAGSSSLLNAPLELASGDHIVLLRLYFNDASTATNVSGWITRYNEAGSDYEDLVAVTSSGNPGHSSNYADLDHVVDTYTWSYVLNARTNDASSDLQICGLRVMYYPLYGNVNFLPAMMENSHP